MMNPIGTYIVAGGKDFKTHCMYAVRWLWQARLAKFILTRFCKLHCNIYTTRKRLDVI